MCHIKSAQPSAPSLIACLKQNSLLRHVVLKGTEANGGGWASRFAFRLTIFFFGLFIYLKKKKRSFVSKHSWHSERALDWSKRGARCLHVLISMQPSLSVTLVFHLDALQPSSLIYNCSFTGYPSCGKLSAVTKKGEQED